MFRDQLNQESRPAVVFPMLRSGGGMMPANEVIRTLAACAAALCRTDTNRPEALATALGADPGSAAVTFNEVILPAPTGLRRLRFLTGPDDHLVRFTELQPDGPLPLADLVELLGPAQDVRGGPHSPAPTVTFADVRVAGAPRTCAVVAALAVDEPDTVTSVTLHPHSAAG
jgi:hypothetical protein